MTDLQNKIEDLNNKIVAQNANIKKILGFTPLIFVASAYFIIQVWPFDKSPKLSAVMVFAVLGYISTFVYAYYAHKRKIRKLKDALEQLD